MRGLKRSKIIVMVMAIVMMIAVPVQAAVGFTDVKEDAWYYPYIEEVQRRGIVDGYEDGTFRPENTVTKAEATKMLVEAKTGGNIEIVESQIAWYTKYIGYGYGVGIQYDESKINEPATRAEVSEYIVKIFRTEEEIGDIELKGKLADTEDLYMEYLYELGVLKGYTEIDGKAVVKPEGKITRAEIVKMLHVMLELEEGPGFVEDTSLGGVNKQVNPKDLYQHELKNKTTNPRTKAQFRAELIDMMLDGDTERKVEYTGLYETEEMKGITEVTKEAFTEVYQSYPEISTYTNGANYRVELTGMGKMTYTLKLDRRGLEQRSPKSSTELKEEFFKDAEVVYRTLEEKGAITENMTEREKAKKLYEWVVVNSEYTDSDYLDNHTGYEQLKTGKVVCQGYVSTYNYLLRLAGIEDVRGVVGKTKMSGSQGHIWTKATLDGETVYIDPTFGDRGGIKGNKDKVNWKYFGMSEDEVRQTHIW